MSWIIYTLKNPRTGDVRYVGYTSKTPEQRLRQHISDSVSSLRKNHKKNHRKRWILSLVSIGLTPEITVIESGSGAGWVDAERRWIALYRASGVRLVNNSDGGDGLIGWGTPEQRSDVAKKRWANWTPEQRAAFINTLKARISPQQRSNAAKEAKGKLTPEELTKLSIKMNAAKTFEQRSATGKSMWANMTPERRSEIAKKRCALKTPEQRSKTASKIYALMTPAQRTAFARAGALQRNLGSARLANPPHK